MKSESASLESSPLVVGIDLRALFDLRAEDEARSGGAEALRRHRAEHEDELLDAGPGLPLARALGHVDPGAARRVEIVLLSRESAEAGLRVVSSARRHELEIARALFTGGEPLDPYLAALGVDLFLCGDGSDVRAALDAGVSAGVVCEGGELAREGEIRVAFDGDAELFSDDGEAGDTDPASRSASRGAPPSFARLLGALAMLGADGRGRGLRLRTALVSSRTGAAQERMLRTVRRFGLQLDEAFFVGDLPRAELLAAFRPHVSFGEHPRAAAGRTLRPVAAVASAEPDEAPRGSLASPLGRLRFRHSSGG
jgi:5'-nucleotidase